MKKIINGIADIEREILEGLVAASPNRIRKLGSKNIVVRKNLNFDKVNLIGGGGSGHEPAHAGYVGYGMLDCAVAGNIFTSPPAIDVLEGILEIATTRGTLCIVKNYTGDVMSFELAIEMAKSHGVDNVDMVVVNDDIAMATNITGRRGVAGTILVHKITGAAAETGAGLEMVKSIAQRTIDNVRTIGVAIKPCTVPAIGHPSFEIPDNEMELGIGIHGEPGIRREQIANADGIVKKMIDRLMTFLEYAGSEVILLINGMGATPMMELLIVNKFAKEYLYRNGVTVYDTMIGNYMTSIDMAGFSMTLLKLDDTLRAFYDASADTFAWKK